MISEIQFLKPGYLILFGVATFIVVMGSMAAFLAKRRRLPGDREVLKEYGRFPSFWFRLFIFFLITLTLGGYFGYLAEPVLETVHKDPICSGPYVAVLRDSSDSTRRENAFIEPLPNDPTRRPNVYTAINAAIEDIVKKHDCFQIALIDFQDHAGVIADFTPIPEKRGEFLEYLKTRPTFAPGSDLTIAINGARALLAQYKEARYKSAIILLSDGGEKLSGWRTGQRSKTLAEVRQERITMFLTGVGTTTPTFVKTYDPVKKEFVDVPDPRARISRNDDMMKGITELTNGTYFVLEKYNDIRTKNNTSHADGISFHEVFDKFIAKHRIDLGEKETKKRDDIGWYFLFTGTVAFLLLSGFTNWLFRIFGFLKRFLFSN